MATPGKTMKVFEELLESPQNRLVEQAVQDGRIPIGYSCSFVPEALLMADKLFPVRLHAPGLAGTEIADNYLSSFVWNLPWMGVLIFCRGRYLCPPATICKGSTTTCSISKNLTSIISWMCRVK